MTVIQQLFVNNLKWVADMTARDPEFFHKLSGQQKPEYLWIGCSDSRVPANDIVGLPPGELFVHRNVANMVVHTDMNLLSVLQYAVDVLQVKHIIVCGHYGCGGVRAAVDNIELGLVDNWLRNIRDLHARYQHEFAELPDHHAVLDRVCELNVIEQAGNVARTTVLQKAWKRGQDVKIHGWIYGIDDGVLKNLNVCIDCLQQTPVVYRVSEECIGCAKAKGRHHKQ